MIVHLAYWGFGFFAGVTFMLIATCLLLDKYDQPEQPKTKERDHEKKDRNN